MVLPAQAERRFDAFLRGRGLKLTRQRRRLLRALPVGGGHVDFDAEHLARRSSSRGVSRDTVYRTLPLLVASGLLRELPHWQGRATRYEWAFNREHHDHLVCESCGTVQDITDDRVVHLRDALCDGEGFRPTRHVLSVFGVCGRCHAGAAPGTQHLQ